VNVCGPSVRGLWSLLWHSVVWLPVALGLFALVCYAWIGFLFLPVGAGVLIWNSEWWRAVICVALWFPSWMGVRWLWRWQRSDAFDHRGDI
jgi:hypothetical protein